MSSSTDYLLTDLNSTNLAKDNNRLYQVLKNLIGNLGKAEQSIITVVSGGGSSGGFVTTSGGTADLMAMFTAAKNIENVTQTGISNALDLLP